METVEIWDEPNVLLDADPLLASSGCLPNQREGRRGGQVTIGGIPRNPGTDSSSLRGRIDVREAVTMRHPFLGGSA